MWVVLLTVIWVLGVPALFFAGVMQSFTFAPDYRPRDPAGSWLHLGAAAAAVLLPLLAAVVAYRANRLILGSVYLVLTVLALVPAGLTVHSAGQDLGWFRPAPAPATPGPPGYCVEHRGGDTRCPGG